MVNSFRQGSTDLGSREGCQNYVQALHQEEPASKRSKRSPQSGGWLLTVFVDDSRRSLRNVEGHQPDHANTKKQRKENGHLVSKQPPNHKPRRFVSGCFRSSLLSHPIRNDAKPREALPEFSRGHSTAPDSGIDYSPMRVRHSSNYNVVVRNPGNDCRETQGGQL